MAIDPEDELDESLAKTPTTADPTPSTPSRPRATSVETGTESEEDDDEEEQDDEPRLKYSRLTGSLGAAYRSGDSTSSFLLAGDKMVGCARIGRGRSILTKSQIVGSHSGNIVSSLMSLSIAHSNTRAECPHNPILSTVAVIPRTYSLRHLRLDIALPTTMANSTICSGEPAPRSNRHLCLAR